MIQKINDDNNKIPVIALKTAVPYPNTMMSCLIGRPTSIKGLQTLDKSKSRNTICLVTQKSEDDINYLYNVGIIADVIEVQYFNKSIKSSVAASNLNHFENNNFSEKNESNESLNKENADVKEKNDPSNIIARIIVSCKSKILIKKIENTKGYQELCDFEHVETTIEDDEALNVAILNLQNQFTIYSHTLENKAPHQKRAIDSALKIVVNQHNLEHKVHYIASYLYTIDYNSTDELDKEQVTANLARGQMILEENSLMKKINMIIEDINERINTINIKTEIEQETEQELRQDYKKVILRKQIEIIKKQLGDNKDTLIAYYKKVFAKIDEKQRPDAYAEYDKMLKKLSNTSSYSPEYSSTVEWLDTASKVLSIKKQEYSKINILKIEENLNKSHYGMTEVKEKILSFISSRDHIRNKAGDKTNDTGGLILCLVGYPGVGKTSLAVEIAKVLGYNSNTISLGGVNDESAIRGHRRTFLGSMPGAIIKGIGTLGSDIGVFILDEIDKIAHSPSGSSRGNPADALLEVLDPKQNNKFTDHYLNFTVDLSKYIFITTANTLRSMPDPLVSRLEIINLPGYTLQEKIVIAEEHIIPNLNFKYEFKFCNLETIKPKIENNYINKPGNSFNINSNESNGEVESAIPISLESNNISSNESNGEVESAIPISLESNLKSTSTKTPKNNLLMSDKLDNLDSEQVKTENTKTGLIFPKESIKTIIEKYTREAGIRELSRKFESIYMEAIKHYKRICEQKTNNNEFYYKDYLNLEVNNLKDYLGIEKYREDIIDKKSQVGVVNGLAYSSIGGSLLQIECVETKGTGSDIVTGNQGDIMRESFKVAKTVANKFLEISGYDTDFSKINLHLHVPDGATPKDGPSAGAAICLAIISCVSKIPVNVYTAITGEITLMGRITAIGGLKEKILGGIKQGVTKFILSKENELDYLDLVNKEEKLINSQQMLKEDAIFSNTNIIFVDKINEVLENMLLEKIGSNIKQSKNKKSKNSSSAKSNSKKTNKKDNK